MVEGEIDRKKLGFVTWRSKRNCQRCMRFGIIHKGEQGEIIQELMVGVIGGEGSS